MIRSVLMSVLLAAGLAGSATSAETITVCAKGCEYTSINAAIAVASDGDVIQLSAETYREGEQIDTLGKAITLRGVPGKDGEPASVLDVGGSTGCRSAGAAEARGPSSRISWSRTELPPGIPFHNAVVAGCTTPAAAARPC